MVVKSSGTSLSFSEIRAEFGNGDNSIGQYRRDDSRFGNKDLGDLEDLPLDAGVPTSGAIKFSDFYGKQLNVVIDCHRTGNNTFNHDAYTDRFLNGNYDIVGNFKSSINKSQWQGGKKVIIHVNNTFGSEGATEVDHVAFLTGNINIDDVNQNGWPTATTLTLDVGDEGLVGGRGGNGANAGNEEDPGANGGNGTSGMKIPSGFQDEISGESRIFGGGGGGGSGSGSEQNNKFAWWADYNSAGGGGGGGGAGIPAGADGTANGPASPQPGGSSDAPSNNDGGDGGTGGDHEEAEGGNGGTGGGRNSNGSGADNGKNLAGANGSGGTGGEQYKFY